MIFLHRQNNSENVVDCEIDIRSHPDGLVLNHDRLDFNKTYPLLKDFAKQYAGLCVICNIKESGIEEEVFEIMSANDINFYFLDSQIPDIIRLSKNEKFHGKFIIRVSDVEEYSEKLINQTKAEFVWIDDCNFKNFNIEEYFERLSRINNNIKPIIVSPELYDARFKSIISDIRPRLTGVSICTKQPDLWR